MSENYKGAAAFIKYLGIKSGESILILTDKESQRGPLDIIVANISRVTHTVEIDDSLPIDFMEDLPAGFERKLSSFDVIILAGKQSWYHTPLRRKAKYSWQKRIVECYGITTTMLQKGALLAEQEEIEEIGIHMLNLLKGGSHLHITTRSGTDFSVEINTIAYETGKYSVAGSGGNIPAGEISIWPKKDSADGGIVFDVSFDSIGAFKGATVHLDIERGTIINISGSMAEQIKDLVSKDQRLKNVAEVGIGTNPHSILYQSILEDEKKLGTVHIGLGNDTYFGGVIRGPHLDGVLNDVTIDADGKIIIRDGRLNLEYPIRT